MEHDCLLSICIPIYNRVEFLKRHLERLYEDKVLFETQVQLIVSDNCSTDNLLAICEEYQEKGLVLYYHRNDVNLGADGNFEWCFNHVRGKYVWLLGSDDILENGVLRKVVNILATNDFGLIHLSMKPCVREISVYTSADRILVDISYWITFLSANIIRSETLYSVDLSDYRQSNMIQVPAYINACCSYPVNAIVYFPKYFEEGSDSKNNGGYNIFEVFVTNLYGIYRNFVRNNALSRRTFDKIKEVEFKDFLMHYIKRFLIYKETNNFILEGSWKHLLRYYWRNIYFHTRVIYAYLRKFL
jgi:glycosyltransferase involved in cell wall biosynthesis